jgi:hypothetical protein
LLFSKQLAIFRCGVGGFRKLTWPDNGRMFRSTPWYRAKKAGE